MKFTPKTEDEISAANLLPGGEYPFEVHEAEDQTSKAGNDMVKLTLHVLDDDERRHVIFDYLVATDAAAYKIRHFAESVGLIAQYEHGEIRAEQMLGCSGTCQVGIDDKNKAYQPKNVIRDYVVSSKGVVIAKTNGKHTDRDPPPIQDDDIPF